MSDKPELYFTNDTDWRTWLLDNHETHPKGVYIILYKLETQIPTMRWEEAVKVALCFGWIDSLVKSLGDGKRRQFFCPRKPKSTWSSLNKNYIVELSKQGLIHKSGKQTINLAKKNGSWSALDDVENFIIPLDLQQKFDKNPKAFINYQNFSPSYRKSYLYWLHHAKRQETRDKRISKIIRLCKANLKTPQ
jgi:uncharacterized protein YdeI (YjbR/CyaY-like superfamily)